MRCREGIRKSPEAVAETIENNVRRLIIDEAPVNPKYYEQMSELLDALILQRKREAIDYRAYVARIVDLTRSIRRPETKSSYPPGIKTAALQALFDNLGKPSGSAIREVQAAYGTSEADTGEATAIAIGTAPSAQEEGDWRGNRIKEREVRNAIKSELGDNEGLVDMIFEIVKAQSDY